MVGSGSGQLIRSGFDQKDSYPTGSARTINTDKIDTGTPLRIILGDDPPKLLPVRGSAPLGDISRVGIHHQGVHEEYHRDREQVATRGKSKTLKV